MAPVTTHSGRHYDKYTNALIYLQDVVELPVFYHDSLQDLSWVIKYVAIPIQQALVLRSLDWATDIPVSYHGDVNIKYTRFL